MYSIFKKIFRCTFDGLLVLLPFFITLVVICYPLNWCAQKVAVYSHRLLGYFLSAGPERCDAQDHHAFFILLKRYINHGIVDKIEWLKCIPFINLLLVAIPLALFGFFTSTVFIRSGVRLMERIIVKVPLLNLLYSYVKESTAGFLGKFNKPVVVTFNTELGIKKLGFIIQEELCHLQLEKSKKRTIAVYIPHSYAFSGELFFFPADKVNRLQITTVEAWKMILSGGLAEIKRPLMRLSPAKKH
ncbi:MAG: DUF502 domain-containing protein [Cytophagales bacterium]